MASLAKVRRLFLLLLPLLLLLLLTLLLLSRRVLKRTHHGRRRRRNNGRRRNGRRKKITRVVVVWIVVVSFNLFSFPSLLLLLSFQTLRASFSSLSLFRSLLLSFVFWCNREEEEDKEEEEEEEEGFSLSLSLLFFWVPRGWKNITQEEERIKYVTSSKKRKSTTFDEKSFHSLADVWLKKKEKFLTDNFYIFLSSNHNHHKHTN